MKLVGRNTKKGDENTKPIIGICVNYSVDDSIGIKTKLGLGGQDWQIIASDYIRAVEMAGGCPVIIPIVQDIDTIWDFIKSLDGIIFTGGSDLNPKYYDEVPRYGLKDVNPVRDEHEIELCKRVLKETELPVLGICRGLQLLNVTLGGTLYQDLQYEREEGFNHKLLNFPKYYPSHKAYIEKGSKLHEIFEKEEIGVNSFNHQAIRTVGKGFIATMKAEDGLIEGIELEGDRFVVAVQWHPEMMIEKYESYVIYFKKFIQICGRSEN